MQTKIKMVSVTAGKRSAQKRNAGEIWTQMVSVIAAVLPGVRMDARETGMETGCATTPEAGVPMPGADSPPAFPKAATEVARVIIGKNHHPIYCERNRRCCQKNRQQRRFSVFCQLGQGGNGGINFFIGGKEGEAEPDGSLVLGAQSLMHPGGAVGAGADGNAKVLH